MEELKKQEQWVLPLDNIVVFPKMKTKIAISDHESVNIKTLINTRNNHMIGLSLKNETEEGKYKESDFYKVGTLLQIDSLQESEEGYVIYIQGVKRVKIEALPSFSIRDTNSSLHPRKHLAMVFRRVNE